jgi:hypothetical protein
MKWIRKPNYFYEQKIKYSKHLNALPSIDIISSPSHFDQDLLKEHCNPKYYQSTIDELFLRGCHQTVRQPDSSESVRLIKVNKDTKRFMNIDYNKLGIPDFIKDFNITSDLFFHNIPLSGFFYLNQQLDIKDIEYELVKNDFLIKSYCINNDLSHHNPSETKISPLDTKCKNSCDNAVIQIINENSDSKPLNTTDHSPNHLHIPSNFDYIDLATLNLSSRTLNALKRANIYSLRELLKLNRTDLENIKNFGKKSFEEVDTLINNIDNDYLDSKKQEKEKCRIRKIKEATKEYLADNNINIVNLGLSVRSVNALKKNGISKACDLVVLSPDEIKNMNNLGQKSRLEIEKIISQLLIGNDSDMLKHHTFQIASCILNTYGNIELSTVTGHRCKSLKGITLNDINNLPLPDLCKHDKKNDIIKNTLFALTRLRPFFTIFHDIDLMENEKLILTERYLRGKTLEESGNRLNITRERARQLQIKGENTFLNGLIIGNFIYNLRIYNNRKKTCSRDFLKAEVCVDDLNYALLEKHSKSPLVYYDPLEIFFLNRVDYDLFIYDLNLYLQNIKTGFDEILPLDRVVDDINQILKKYDIKDTRHEIIKGIISGKLFVYGNIVATKPLSNLDIIALIYDEYIEGSLRFDEKGYEAIQKIARQSLNYDHLPSSYRSIENKIGLEENLVLVDGLTYIHISKLELDTEIIRKLDNYIEISLNSCNNIPIKKLIADNHNLIKGSVFENKRTAYSLLKSYLGDKYVFGHKNNFTIYKNDNSTLFTAYDVLYNLIKHEKNGVHKKDILSELNWSQVKLSNTITNYNEFILLKNSKVLYFDVNNICPNDLKLLSHLIEDNMQYGFLCTYKIYNEMLENKKNSALLGRYRITDAYTLAKVFRIIDSNLIGRQTCLFDRRTNFRTIQDVIADRFVRTHKKQVKDFLRNKGMNEVSVFSQYYRLIDNGIYTEISEDEIIRTDSFWIAPFVQEAVINMVITICKEQGYISLNKINDFSSLPQIEYSWNINLIKSILLMNKYHLIERKLKDYRSDQLLLAPPGNTCTFEELVYQLITEEYTGSMYESYVYDFLVLKGVFPRRKELHKKRFPQELQNCKYIEVDEVGMVYIKA